MEGGFCFETLTGSPARPPGLWLRRLVEIFLLGGFILLILLFEAGIDLVPLTWFARSEHSRYGSRCYT
jgi:hypothetical protein